jgi:hypothetical protein
MSKPRLYIDIDDTIIGRYYPTTFLELRPGVMGQLKVLSKLFDCRWLTCWPWVDPKSNMDIKTLLRVLYSHDLVAVIPPQKWSYETGGKSGAVLAPGQPTDFWWLEDQLPKDELADLQHAWKLDRYIHVSSRGAWAFADACLELFKRAGVTEEDIKKADGEMRFFQKERYLDPVIWE